VLRDHLPQLLNGVRKKFPGVKVSLREGYAARLGELLAIGALWRGKNTPLLDAFLDMARQRAREIV